MNTYSILRAAVIGAIALLTGCTIYTRDDGYYSGGGSDYWDSYDRYRQYEYDRKYPISGSHARDLEASIDKMGRVRDKSMHEKPKYGAWEKRTFSTDGNIGYDVNGGERGGVDVRWNTQGYIPNDHP
ncbi:MAG: hypothetical protein KC877_04285 [Candidatus Kaiserbacteria bacterium]|nr:hypothetical protein [Candidatus Kaiserbacteria bacterium]MCB9815981.1 hypothetical protein [Candidatus Nomurabacteria bacterium]